jgi:hypothetical protein
MPVFDHLRAYFLFMCNHQNMRPSAPHFLFACFVPENGRAGAKNGRGVANTGAQMEKRARRCKNGRWDSKHLSN